MASFTATRGIPVARLRSQAAPSVQHLLAGTPRTASGAAALERLSGLSVRRPRLSSRRTFARGLSCSADSGTPDSEDVAPQEISPTVVTHQRKKTGAHMLRTLSANKECVVTVCIATDVVQDAINRHNTAPTASAALGRALTGTLLLSSFKGEGDHLTVTFKGDGPLGQMTVVGTHQGEVKGFVGNPGANATVREDGKLDVAGVVGQGSLQVVRSVPKMNPVSGIVPITSGEVAEDLAVYLRDSEQTNTALGLGVSIGRDGGCAAAGGFLVEVLPFASEATLQGLEENIQLMPPTTQMLEDGADCAFITDFLLLGLNAADKDTQRDLTPQYGPCEMDKLKERMLRSVASIPPKEIEEIIAEQGSVEVRCEFCAETVNFSKEDLQPILEK